MEVAGLVAARGAARAAGRASGEPVEEVDLDETGQALALMAQTICEGFALLHLDSSPGARPQAIYANPALAKLVGDVEGLDGFCDSIRLDLTAACRGPSANGRRWSWTWATPAAISG